MQAPYHQDGAGSRSGSSLGQGFGMPRRVRAILGPTNTGKTHYALDRLLAHRTGLIGFPLRLLARENYERMVAAKGAALVALITGEEKIVPPGARWFSCTVEAMPLDAQAEFVAVDEIQLCADPDRGHVFTDRLLNARGSVETLFLGAETIRPLMTRLVPGVEIETRPRLSSLVHAGAIKLAKLPPRSAIVAFSAAEVYAIAEIIRRRRGGCAVIMGQLSPRTRNAQVALYQNKEVDYLVATDAIGMGLNMDVSHVALAALRKFDGTRPRALLPQEVAQIAGRAGRGSREGTFGTTGDCAPMSPSLVEAIETHRFDPIERLSWRNTNLDFQAPQALLTSLLRPAPKPGLTAGRVASDLATLDALTHDQAILDAIQRPSHTRLLWEVCQIPDFRKLGDDSHIRLCARIFFILREHGAIPAQWFESQIRAFDKIEGDIDTLMHRLSAVRICAYVAAKTEWSRNATQWQERTRTIEDKLSDALHERLTARFVDRRATSLLRRLDEGGERNLLSAVTREGDIVVEGHAIGRMVGFALQPDAELAGSDQKHVLRAGRQALVHEMPRRVQAFLQSPDAAFRIEWPKCRILWNGVDVARLVRGTTFMMPDVKMLPGEFLHAGQRDQVAGRLRDFMRTSIAHAFLPLTRVTIGLATEPSLRGLAHRLEEDGGLTALTPADRTLNKSARTLLRHKGLVLGASYVFGPAILKPSLMGIRAALLALWNGQQAPSSQMLNPARVSHPRTPGEPDFSSLGWVAAGPIWLRLDVAERARRNCAQATARGQRPAPLELASCFGIQSQLLPDILKALRIRHMPPGKASRDYVGPPLPLMLLPAPKATTHSRRQIQCPQPRTDIDRPFAALAHWRAL